MNTWLRYCLLRPPMVWHKSIVPSWLPRHWNSSGHTKNHITCRAQLVLPKDSACLCLHPWHLHCSEWRRRRRHLPCEVVNINWFIIHQYKFVLSLSQSHLANPTHSHSKMSVIIKTLTMVISGRWYHELMKTLLWVFKYVMLTLQVLTKKTKSAFYPKLHDSYLIVMTSMGSVGDELPVLQTQQLYNSLASSSNPSIFHFLFFNYWLLTQTAYQYHTNHLSNFNQLDNIIYMLHPNSISWWEEHNSFQISSQIFTVFL